MKRRGDIIPEIGKDSIDQQGIGKFWGAGKGGWTEALRGIPDHVYHEHIGTAE